MTIRSVSLGRRIIGWYSWVEFYKWVIKTCLVILTIFIGFTGFVLLYQQNNFIKKQTEQLFNQNELIGLSISTSIRKNILAKSTSSDLTRKQDSNEVSHRIEKKAVNSADAKCGITFNHDPYGMQTSPNQSSTSDIR